MNLHCLFITSILCNNVLAFILKGFVYIWTTHERSCFIAAILRSHFIQQPARLKWGLPLFCDPNILMFYSKFTYSYWLSFHPHIVSSLYFSQCKKSGTWHKFLPTAEKNNVYFVSGVRKVFCGWNFLRIISECSGVLWLTASHCMLEQVYDVSRDFFHYIKCVIW